MSAKVETLNLSDGSTVAIMRPADLSDAQWSEYKEWYESNPEEAYAVKNYNTNADAIRSQMAQDTISSYLWAKIDSGDSETQRKLEALQQDRELKYIFDDIAAHGGGAAVRYMSNEQLMVKISKKMGGLPDEVKPLLKNLYKTPYTIYEACKMGEKSYVEDWLANPTTAQLGEGINEKDFKGCSALAYAVGCDSTAIAKLLIEKNADASKCDNDGNTAIHYAAGYGRVDMVKYLTGLARADKGAKNNDGKTAKDMAVKNKQDAAAKLL